MPDALLHRRTPAELKSVIAAERDGVAFIEYRDGDDVQRLVALDDEVERLTVGRMPGCELALVWDDEVSRAHALLERVGGAWTVEDRGSSNGTLVNASRITGPVVLRDADVIRVGRTQLVFHDASDAALRRTTPAMGRVAPAITESQRKVLLALCRPALEAGGGAASNREIAEALYVSVETVKTHMRALFDAFDLHSSAPYRKRFELVRKAVEVGLVSPPERR